MGHMKVGQRTVPGPTLSAGEMVDPGDATFDLNSLPRGSYIVHIMHIRTWFNTELFTAKY